MPETRNTTLDTLLEFIKESRGFDFTGYKRSSIGLRTGASCGRTAGMSSGVGDWSSSSQPAGLTGEGVSCRGSIKRA